MYYCLLHLKNMFAFFRACFQSSCLVFFSGHDPARRSHSSCMCLSIPDWVTLGSSMCCFFFCFQRLEQGARQERQKNHEISFADSILLHRPNIESYRIVVISVDHLDTARSTFHSGLRVDIWQE